MSPKTPRLQTPKTTTHMGKRCGRCGNVGKHDEQLVTCFRCKITCEHIFCMRETLNGVPRIWVCDECRSSSMTRFSDLFFNCPIPKGTRSKVLRRRRQVFCSPLLSRSHYKKERVPKKSKVKFLSIKEIFNLSSGQQNRKELLPQQPLTRINKRLTSNPSSIPNAYVTQHCKKGNPEGNLQNQKMIGNSGPVRKIVLPVTPVLLHSQAAIGSDKKCSLSAIEKVPPGFEPKTMPPSYTHTKVPPGFEPKNVSMGFTHTKVPPGCEAKVVVSGSNTIPDSIFDKRKKTGPSPSANEGSLHSHPKYQNNDIQRVNQFVSFNFSEVEEAVWCGSFRVFCSLHHEEYYDGFRACLLGKVHLKTVETSKHIPGILKSELIPCCNVWRNLFPDGRADVNDIALYFFPGNFQRSMEQYAKLLELMETNDSVLRSCINNVELYVTSSKRLHHESWGFTSKPFLWGVYHKRPSRPAQDSNARLKGKQCFTEVKVEPSDVLYTPRIYLENPRNDACQF